MTGEIRMKKGRHDKTEKLSKETNLKIDKRNAK